MQRVLADPKLSIYACGRNDIQTGQIDRRVLAVMEYLVAKGYRLDDHLAQVRALLPDLVRATSPPTPTAPPSTSPRSTGSRSRATRGPGSITEAVIKDLLAAAGDDAPRPDHLPDGPRPAHLHPARPLEPHPRRLHVLAAGSLQQLGEILKPEQWQRLIQRLGEIRNPKVPSKPSDAALPAKGHSKGD